MIDLTKDQIVDPPVKCWVRDNETSWIPRWLVAIVDDSYFTIDGDDHSRDVKLVDAFRYGRCAWQQCSLTDPTVPVKKIKKWLTVEDVPVELWGRALIKHKKERPQLAVVMSPYEITNYEGLLLDELHYLPLGQPLTGEWLPFESEVVE